jgi:RNA polymerase sigma-70 factor, ECF subfamily
MSEKEFRDQLLDIENSLEKFAYSLTRSKADAEDLVQETLLKGLLNEDKYVNKENFKAWTFTIMKNTFINGYRRRSRQGNCFDQTQGSSLIKQTNSSDSDNPDTIYSFLEMTQIIEQLDDKLRIPFKMHFQGYKYQEIGDALNINIGTVKSRIFISRKQLKDRLKV